MAGIVRAAKGPEKMIKIKLPTQVHRPGPDYEPMVYHPENRMMMDGVYDIEVLDAFTPFEIEEKKGRALVAQFAHLGAIVVGEKEDVDLVALAMAGPSW